MQNKNFFFFLFSESQLSGRVGGGGSSRLGQNPNFNSKFVLRPLKGAEKNCFFPQRKSKRGWRGDCLIGHIKLEEKRFQIGTKPWIYDRWSGHMWQLGSVGRCCQIGEGIYGREWALSDHWGWRMTPCTVSFSPLCPPKHCFPVKGAPQQWTGLSDDWGWQMTGKTWDGRRPCQIQPPPAVTSVCQCRTQNLAAAVGRGHGSYRTFLIIRRQQLTILYKQMLILINFY